MEENKKNIYQKLAVIQETILGLGKDKQAFGYKYVTGDKVLGMIKPIMVKEGLILKQEIISIDNETIDYTSKKGQAENVNIGEDYIVLRKREDDKREILTRVMMRFTWVDIETGETDINLFGANGQNGFDKGVGSALTYAERYFLLKYFHIATDEDDIDQPDPEATPETPKKLPDFNPNLKAWTQAVVRQATVGDLEAFYTISEENKRLYTEALNVEMLAKQLDAEKTVVTKPIDQGKVKGKEGVKTQEQNKK